MALLGIRGRRDPARPHPRFDLGLTLPVRSRAAFHVLAQQLAQQRLGFSNPRGYRLGQRGPARLRQPPRPPGVGHDLTEELTLLDRIGPVDRGAPFETGRAIRKVAAQVVLAGPKFRRLSRLGGERVASWRMLVPSRL